MISNEKIREYLNKYWGKKNANIRDIMIEEERLYLNPKESNILRIRISTQRKLVEAKKFKAVEEGMVEREETQDALNLTYKGDKSITTLEEAIRFFEIDLKAYKVVKFSTNAWDVTMKVKTDKGEEPVKKTNYQVKVFLEPIIDEEKEFIETLEKMVKEVRSRPRFKKNTCDGSGVGVVCIADLHAGAKTNHKKGVIRTKDFDVETLIRYTIEAADLINAQSFEEVHVSFLGDLIESLTGLNHVNSWYSMQEDVVFGNAITVAYEIVGQFLSRINNLSKVYMVPGNHDRATDRNDHDVTGTAAQLVAYMLKRDYDITYHPLLVSKMIDNIHYVFTHDHFGFSKKDLGKIFYEYGKQGHYNVMASGHWHQSNTKKPFVSESTPIQAVNYRAITVQPFFTGNFYSESLGFTSAPGLSVIRANERKDNIHHYDLAL